MTLWENAGKGGSQRVLLVRASNESINQLEGCSHTFSVFVDSSENSEKKLFNTTCNVERGERKHASQAQAND